MPEEKQKEEPKEPELKTKPAQEEPRSREEKLGVWSDDPKLQ